MVRTDFTYRESDPAMDLGVRWKLHGDGRTPAPGAVVIGVGGVTIKFTDNFTLSGIALGTLVVITGYHALRFLAPAHLKTDQPLLDEGTSSYDSPGEAGQRAKS